MRIASLCLGLALVGVTAGSAVAAPASGHGAKAVTARKASVKAGGKKASGQASTAHRKGQGSARHEPGRLKAGSHKTGGHKAGGRTAKAHGAGKRAGIGKAAAAGGAAAAGAALATQGGKAAAGARAGLTGPLPDNYAGRAEVQAFVQEMVAQHGFDAQALHALFERVAPNARTLALMAPPPPPPPPPPPRPVPPSASGDAGQAAGNMGNAGGAANTAGSTGDAGNAGSTAGGGNATGDAAGAAAQAGEAAAPSPVPVPVPPPRPQPDWTAYRARFIEPGRIDGGVAFATKYAKELDRATAEYGVPGPVIAAIIGVETFYGRNTGKFPVVQALATLAFDFPARAPYFRRELEEFLLYCRENGLDPLAPRGSYAGAIGTPQFMPGSIRKFATDFDRDGRIDLVNSPVDAIGSVARFLSIHGWQRDLPIYRVADMGAGADPAPLLERGPKPELTATDLQAAGFPGQLDLPPGTGVLLVDLPRANAPTDYVIGTANFYAITRYNRSFMYAMAVTNLAEEIGLARAVRGAEPR